MKSLFSKIFPLGDNGVTVEFGNEISTLLNDKAIFLSSHFDKKPFPGFIESVPAYASLTIFYDPFKVRKNFPQFQNAFEAVKRLAKDALRELDENGKRNPRLIKIPVNFGRDFALDLEYIASENNLSPERVVEIFTAGTYRVFMLGFMPAFPYMGEVDEKIATARKKTPRLLVPSGSVGIAGKQTGIYPFDSPGGWQIVGRTNFELFTPEKRHPCALDAGDLVEFYSSYE